MLIPKLRFKREDGTEFPKWEERKISEICEPHARIGWQNLRTDEFLDNGDYYLITGTDFRNGRVNFLTCHYIDQSRYEQDKNIQITNGSILITKDGTLGKIALVENMDKAGTLNAGVFVLQNLNKCIYNVYLFQYLTAPYLLNFASDKSTGGTIKHLNQGILVQFPVPVPCLEEQQKIADFLSTVDEVIAQSEAEVRNLEQQKKGAMQKIFSQEVRFRRDDRTEFPQWAKLTLGDIGEVAMCKRILKEQTSENGDVPFFKISTFGSTPDAFISLQLFNEFKQTYRYPSKGAVLISAAGTIGKIIRYNGENAYYQDSNIVWLEHSENVTDDFLYQFYQQVTWEGLEGSTIKRLYNKNLLETAIMLPCLEEQQKIADFLSAYDEAITYAKQELEKWKELKKGLLQQMFV